MTIHRIKLKDLNAQFLQQLRAQYTDQELEIAFWLSPKSINKSAHKHLSEDQFWQLINLLDWEKTGDSNAVIEPLVASLSTRSIEAIQTFEDRLSEKLYLLDGEQYAQHTGDNAYKDGREFSVDTFLYARCCVIANGQEFYKSVLDNPLEMPKNLTFSALLRVASTAYLRKTNTIFKYQPIFLYETFSNLNGWSEDSFVKNILTS